jgi:hypothetical protein
VEKNGKKLRLIQASLKDNSDGIAVTLFGNNIDKVDEKMTYAFTNLRISKYLSQTSNQ